MTNYKPSSKISSIKPSTSSDGISSGTLRDATLRHQQVEREKRDRAEHRPELRIQQTVEDLNRANYERYQRQQQEPSKPSGGRGGYEISRNEY